MIFDLGFLLTVVFVFQNLQLKDGGLLSARYYMHRTRCATKYWPQTHFGKIFLANAMSGNTGIKQSIQIKINFSSNACEIVSYSPAEIDVH